MIENSFVVMLEVRGLNDRVVRYSHSIETNQHTALEMMRVFDDHVLNHIKGRLKIMKKGEKKDEERS
jgi:hypothetical protein